MNKGTRGQFARFVIHVNLSLPLVSKVRITNKLHRIKYELLPQICFGYEKFGHLKDACPDSLIDVKNGTRTRWGNS